MQTFLPYPSFTASAETLDRQRLGKQRVEAWQVYTSLTVGGGWANHPAVAMWRGAEAALTLYGSAMCREWIARGYRDTMLPRFVAARAELGSLLLPEWLGDPDFHRAHQSNLIRKAPELYAHLWPSVPPDLPYIWPG